MEKYMEQRDIMPDHKTHRLVNKLLLGKEYEEVNMILDIPYKFLGPRHRILMHDLKTTPFLVALLTKDVKKGMAAAVHILTDKADKKLLKLLTLIKKHDR